MLKHKILSAAIDIKFLKRHAGNKEVIAIGLKKKEKADRGYYRAIL